MQKIDWLIVFAVLFFCVVLAGCGDVRISPTGPSGLADCRNGAEIARPAGDGRVPAADACGPRVAVPR